MHNQDIKDDFDEIFDHISGKCPYTGEGKMAAVDATVKILQAKFIAEELGKISSRLHTIG